MRCGKCGEDKPTSAFGQDAHAPIGLRTVCRRCRAARRAALRLADPELLAREAAYQAARRAERRLWQEWEEIIP